MNSIITQGYLTRFIIPSGYDFDVNSPINQVITNVLRLTDQFIVVGYETANILSDHLFLTDSFIVEGHTQRTWSDFLVLEEPFVTIKVDNRFVTSPSWIVYITKKGPDNLPVIPSYITLYSINGSILLPNPVFGDSEESVNEVLINNTVGGKRFSYVKTSKRRKLEYKFEFRYSKMIELQNFLDACNLDWLTLINWKQEIWNIKIVTNPIIYESISIGWFSVILDMEGYLILQGDYHCLE